MSGRVGFISTRGDRITGAVKMPARGRHWQRKTRKVLESFSINQLIASLSHFGKSKMRIEKDRELLAHFVETCGIRDDPPTRFHNLWEKLELRDMLLELRRLAFRKQDGLYLEIVGAFIRLCDLLLLHCGNGISQSSGDESLGFASFMPSLQELARCLDGEESEASPRTTSI